MGWGTGRGYKGTGGGERGSGREGGENAGGGGHFMHGRSRMTMDHGSW